MIKWIKKVAKFLYALFWHCIEGFPTCNKKEILERYNICINCEEFNKKLSICNECGCNLSDRKEFMNKLAWADQECPLSKWLAKENQN